VNAWSKNNFDAAELTASVAKAFVGVAKTHDTQSCDTTKGKN